MASREGAAAQHLATESDPIADSSPQGKGRYFFYRARHGKATAYLFGSLHFGKKEFYPLQSRVESAFSVSPELVVEANIDPEFIAKSGGLPPQKKSLPVETTVTNETAILLKQRLEALKLDYHSIKQMDTAYFSLLLVHSLLSAAGLTPEWGVDLYFLRKAKTAGKSIVELEGLQEQMDLFATYVNQKELADLGLRNLLRRWSTMPEQFRLLGDSWEKGDDNLIPSLEEQDTADFPPELRRDFQEGMYFKRNRMMAGKIKEMLAAQRNVFVVVGTLHLHGPEGIPMLLQRAGFLVERL